VKLGHPVPESNLSFDVNSGWPVVMSTYRPRAWLSQYRLWNGTSVSARWVTLYCSGLSSLRSSASLGLAVRIGRGVSSTRRSVSVDCAPHAAAAAARMIANSVRFIQRFYVPGDTALLAPGLHRDGVERLGVKLSILGV